ncbi:MAG TPA: YggS family pyridoxal phosphate-dependent enzyme [Alloacidobacterium sp.]|nr:YggS family pyridoxal phosphate-dependent enzyme [Alloacidobacterium sp.]
MLSIQEITQNIETVKAKIVSTCRQAGRPAEEVALMAVSKTHPAEAISAAYAAGLRLFGENRVQEFEQKSSALKDLDIAVHLIGHLQSNKTARAAEIFSGIDTVDSLKLAQRLNDAAGKSGRKLSVLIEIKMSEEVTKTGMNPASRELEELLEQLPDLPHLEMRGLMTVAPLDENPETARSCFRGLRRLRDTLAAQHSRLSFQELSMGMSGDFAIAIEEGSTVVRIGTAIFGARPKPA